MPIDCDISVVLFQLCEERGNNVTDNSHHEQLFPLVLLRQVSTIVHIPSVLREDLRLSTIIDGEAREYDARLPIKFRSNE